MISIKRRVEAWIALVHVLLALGGASAIAYVIASHVIQQARSEGVSSSRSALDRAAVKLAGLVESGGTSPVPPAGLSGSPIPVGGSLLPANVSPRVDGFGTQIGYCVGAPVVATDAVFALLSAGGNKSFETTCAQALANSRVGDDLAFRVNVAQLFGGFSGVSFFGSTVAKEAHLGSILTPRAGEVRAVAETGVIYVNASGKVGDWTALNGGAAVVGLVVGADGVRRWADGSYAKSCSEYRYPSGLKVYRNAVGDGAYRIQPGDAEEGTLDVACDMTRDGGGWTVFQRRKDGSVNFYRPWADYVAGFGSLNGEFWLGLDKLYRIAGTARTLRVDLGRYNSQIGYAKYSSFSIGPAETNYVLHVAGYSDGNVGDSLASYHNGFPFGTYDAPHQSMNCPQIYRGAWWYAQCHEVNLNGQWLNGPHTSFADGIEWKAWTGYYESLTFTEMKVR